MDPGFSKVCENPNLFGLASDLFLVQLLQTYLSAPRHRANLRLQLASRLRRDQKTDHGDHLGWFTPQLFWKPLLSENQTFTKYVSVLRERSIVPQYKSGVKSRIALIPASGLKNAACRNYNSARITDFWRVGGCRVPAAGIITHRKGTSKNGRAIRRPDIIYEKPWLLRGPVEVFDQSPTTPLELPSGGAV